jgi:hypothetical protein
MKFVIVVVFVLVVVLFLLSSEKKPNRSSVKKKTRGQIQVQEASFEDKWSRSRMVNTDDTETKLISTPESKYKGTRERFLYYYSFEDVEKIIDHWKLNDNGVTIKPEYEKQLEYKDITFPAMYKFTVYRIEKESSSKENKKHVLVESLLHAREVASLNVNIAFFDTVIYGDPQHLLDSFVFHVVFVANPYGYFLDSSRVYKAGNELFNFPGLCHRKNGNVDDVVYSEFMTLQQKLESFLSPEVLREIEKRNEIVAFVPSQSKGKRMGVDLNRNFNKVEGGLLLWDTLKRVVERKSDPNVISEEVVMDELKKNRRARRYTNEELGDYAKYITDFFKKYKNVSKIVETLEQKGLWNFDDKGSSGDPRADDFRGTGSEPEADAFQEYFSKFHKELDFQVFISLHGFMNSIVIPSEMKSLPIPFTRSDKKRYESRLSGLRIGISNDKREKLSDKNRRADVMVYDPTSIEYPVNGDQTDWVHMVDVQEFERNAKKKNKIISVVVELGNASFDRFYPNKYEMVDIVNLGVSTMVEILLRTVMN